MAMSEEQARAAIRELLNARGHEREKLQAIHDYVRGHQKHPVAPPDAKPEVRALTKLARVNIMDIVVAAVAQGLYVDGYRGSKKPENNDVWKVWQANKLDARQVAVHRGAITYGTSYATVLPGVIPATEEDTAVIRGFSPRRMTTLYGADPDWPEIALSSEPMRKKWRYRLFDENEIWTFIADPDMRAESANSMVLEDQEEHGQGVTPVVRFLNIHDIDEDNLGEVEPLMVFQDQLDLTTFELLVAQHYGSFRQRYIIGWVGESETKALSATASRLWMFEDNPEDVKVGEFEQTKLDGYLDSREATLRHAASISQTPVHELIGQLVNLSAEALVAAEAGQRRKIAERQVSFGESWEQVLRLAAKITGSTVEDDAEVRWRDTESRALASTVDALGKMAQMLMVPPEVLWEKIPGVTQQDVERWKEQAKESDALGNLTSMLDRQMGANNGTPDGRPNGTQNRRLPSGAA